MTDPAHAGAPAVDLDKELAQLHRYTVTGEGTTRGYFRLVEDAEGAWLTFAEVEAFVERLRVSSRSPEPDNALQIACAELAGYQDGFEGLPVQRDVQDGR